MAANGTGDAASNDQNFGSITGELFHSTRARKKSTCSFHLERMMYMVAIVWIAAFLASFLMTHVLSFSRHLSKVVVVVRPTFFALGRARIIHGSKESVRQLTIHRNLKKSN